MRYGFKVHSLELARGISGRRRLAAKTCTNEDETTAHKKRAEAAAAGGPQPAPLLAGDYLDFLVEALTDLKDSEVALTDVPKLIAVADGANEFVPSADPGTIRMRVTKVEVTNRRVSVELDYGYLGYAHKAIAERVEDDAELDDKSPAETYRTEFLIPDKGTIGIIATESISRGSSMPALNAWINHVARQKYGDESFVRLMTPQLSDTEKLDKLLKGDTVSEIRLTKRGPAGDGVPSDNVLILTEQVRNAKTMGKAKDLIKTWVELIRQENKMTEEERLAAIQTLAGIVGPAFEEVGFNDGVVKLDPGSGRKVEVRPSRIGELFTYEISDLKPNTTMWEDRTKTQLLAMAKAENLSVAWS